MKTLSKFLEKLVFFDKKISIIHLNTEFTYYELYNEIIHNKSKLQKLKIKTGEVVFLLGDYSFNSISLFFSLALNGNIIVPITSENDQEIKERISIIQPDWVIDLKNKTETKCENKNYAERHKLLGSLIESNTAGLILFSSGSTGKPKAMIHDLENLLKFYIDKKGRDMNFLVFLMFDHIGGLNTLFNCLSMGVTITIPQNRNPDDIAKLIEKFKINVLPSSPTFLNLMYISNVFDIYDLRSIKMITYGTEAMPESLLMKLKFKLPGVKFLQTFGTSETGIIKTSSLSSSSTFLKFDDPSQEFKIVNSELWLRSKTQILGYINHSNESFTEDGWFMTGDIVEQTHDGYLKIIGRKNDVINVGGEKVLPAEVESVIMELNFIEDCIVKAENNSITGQMVCADVVMKQGYDFKNEKLNIKKYCMQKLDSYKVPVRITHISQVEVTNRFKKFRNKK